MHKRIPSRHRGHRQCACNFQLTPQDFPPSELSPTISFHCGWALSLIIDRNVRYSFWGTSVVNRTRCYPIRSDPILGDCHMAGPRDISRMSSAFVALSESSFRPRTLPFSHSVLSTGYSACSGFYGPNNGHDRSIVAHPKKKCIAFFMRPKRWVLSLIRSFYSGISA